MDINNGAHTQERELEFEPLDNSGVILSILFCTCDASDCLSSSFHGRIWGVEQYFDPENPYKDPESRNFFLSFEELDLTIGLTFQCFLFNYCISSALPFGCWDDGWNGRLHIL